MAYKYDSHLSLRSGTYYFVLAVAGLGVLRPKSAKGLRHQMTHEVQNATEPCLRSKLMSFQPGNGLVGQLKQDLLFESQARKRHFRRVGCETR